MAITIYVIENTINDKKYIGQTSGTLKKRFGEHMRADGCPALFRAVKKYGRENFSIRALIICPDDQDYVNEMEKRTIEVYNTIAPSGYNIKEGGSNGRLAEATKEKLRKVVRTFSKETRAKMAASAAGNTNALGHLCSEESRAKMSVAALGRISPMKGKVTSSETRAKQSIAKIKNPVKYWLGRNHSKETSSKISESLISFNKNKKNNNNEVNGV